MHIPHTQLQPRRHGRCTRLQTQHKSLRQTCHMITSVYAAFIICHQFRRAQPRLTSATFVCVILAGSSLCRSKTLIWVSRCIVLCVRKARPGRPSKVTMHAARAYAPHAPVLTHHSRIFTPVRPRYTHLHAPWMCASRTQHSPTT